MVLNGTSLNCNNALLVLNGTSLNCNNALMVLNGTSLNCNSALLVLNGTSLISNNALLVDFTLARSKREEDMIHAFGNVAMEENGKNHMGDEKNKH